MIEKTFYVQKFLLRVSHVYTRFKKRCTAINLIACGDKNLLKVTICLQFDSQRSNLSETDSQNQQFFCITIKTTLVFLKFIPLIPFSRRKHSNTIYFGTIICGKDQKLPNFLFLWILIWKKFRRFTNLMIGRLSIPTALLPYKWS